MSIIEKELLKTYEEMFDDESHIMLKWDIYSNDNNKSNDKNNRFGEYTNKKESSNKLSSSNKIHDNYLDNLKEACVAGVGTCSLSSIITGSYGVAAGTAAAKSVIATFPAFTTQITNALIGVKFFYISLLETTINAVTPTQFISFLEGSGTIVNAAGAGTAAFFPYGMAIVALIAITIIVIIYMFGYATDEKILGNMNAKNIYVRNLISRIYIMLLFNCT
ncbi:PIR protein, pseudogene, putative [Plasmodium sp.]|nr:PIR protein, pseudogene, putative [Plasmodium sp.]